MTVQDLKDYAIKPFYSDYIKAVLQDFAETIIQDDSLSDTDRYELMDWKVKQLENDNET